MLPTKKNILQKVSKVIAVICLCTAVVSAIYTFTLSGAEDMVIKSSFGALSFFCFTVALVLNTIATTNLPNLKVPKDGKQLNENPVEHID